MLRTLLVCKDEAVVQTVTRVFKTLDVAVEHCTDRPSAVQRMTAKRFDAVMADEHVDDAYTVLERARELPNTEKSIRIVVVGAPTTIGTAFQTAAQIVLYKPLSLERVRQGLRAVRNLMARERRRGSKRIEVEIPATIFHGKMSKSAVLIEDISDSGAAVRCADKLPSSRHIVLECVLPETSETVKATAEVVWSDAKGISGLRFVDMPAASRKALAEWLKTQNGDKASSVSATATSS